ncbi:MAG: hypothetical protein KKG75_03460 [Nanoarchaeota archaeon]|nr:hypothetical protein [Nanoarchaeota archaeon]
MKVLSVITGIGYGHSIREAAILKYLKKNNFDVVVAGYNNSYEYFEKKYETLRLLGMNFPERKFKYSNFKVIFKNIFLPIKHVINYFKLLKLNKIYQPDIIIADLEPIALSIAKSKPHFLVFNYDPEIYEEYVKKSKKKFRFLAYVYNLIYKKAAKKNYPIIVSSLTGKKPNKNIYYVNPIIREIPKTTNVLRKFKDPILISMGGSYFGSEILDRLLHILPEFEEDFIIFGYKVIGKNQNNIHFMEFKENFLEYLKASKAIICLGGHNTLSEAVVLKKPSLVFPVPNYIEQILNAYEIEKNNFGLSKILKHPLDESEIKNAMEEFLNNLEKYQKVLDKKNIKGNGAEQVYKIIKETTK